MDADIGPRGRGVKMVVYTDNIVILALEVFSSIMSEIMDVRWERCGA